MATAGTGPRLTTERLAAALLATSTPTVEKIRDLLVDIHFKEHESERRWLRAPSPYGGAGELLTALGFQAAVTGASDAQIILPDSAVEFVVGVGVGLVEARLSMDEDELAVRRAKRSKTCHEELRRALPGDSSTTTPTAPATTLTSVLCSQSLVEALTQFLDERSLDNCIATSLPEWRGGFSTTCARSPALGEATSVGLLMGALHGLERETIAREDDSYVDHEQDHEPYYRLAFLWQYIERTTTAPVRALAGSRRGFPSTLSTQVRVPPWFHDCGLDGLTDEQALEEVGDLVDCDSNWDGAMYAARYKELALPDFCRAIAPSDPRTDPNSALRANLVPGLYTCQESLPGQYGWEWFANTTTPGTTSNDANSPALDAFAATALGTTTHAAMAQLDAGAIEAMLSGQASYYAMHPPVVQVIDATEIKDQSTGSGSGRCAPAHPSPAPPSRGPTRPRAGSASSSPTARGTRRRWRRCSSARS